MGWAYCGQQVVRVPKWGHPNGGFEKREIGYGIEATCDAKDCNEVIDRGLGCICGEMHHMPWDGGERGCGRYYCDKHLGWVGERGGCSHPRSFVAWGKTLCQPMKREATYWTDGSLHKPEQIYCACLKDHPVEWSEGEL